MLFIILLSISTVFAQKEKAVKLIYCGIISKGDQHFVEKTLKDCKACLFIWLSLLAAEVHMVIHLSERRSFCGNRTLVCRSKGMKNCPLSIKNAVHTEYQILGKEIEIASHIPKPFQLLYISLCNTENTGISVTLPP